MDHRKFIDPNGQNDREPKKITAERPVHMAHMDV